MAKIEDDNLREEQLGKLGEKEDEEEYPATEQRTEYTDLGLELGEREKQIACHASALALAMTDKAHREAEMKALRLSLTVSSTSADHQAVGWRLMRPKGMEDLAAFSVRKVKGAAVEERESDEYSSPEGQ